MMQKLQKLWKNPMVRRLVFWAGPIVIGWVLAKLDPEPSKQQSKKSR